MKGIIQLFLMLVLAPLYQTLTLVAENDMLVGVQWASDGKSYIYSDFLTGISTIYRVGSDGSQLSTLVAESEVAMPRLSPDGSEIVYVRADDTGHSLQIMNADGSQERLLVELDGMPAHISWAPDNSKILVQSSEVFVITPDGSDKTVFNNSQVGSDLMWSPDSTQIAFQNSGQMWVMDADGSNAHALFTLPFDASGFSWSPDGKRMAFITTGMTYHPKGGVVLYSLSHVNANDGSDRFQVAHPTQDPITSYQWSPDSSRIAHARNGQIGIVGASGDGTIFLTNGPSSDSQPTWSPDGEQIAFVSDRDNAAELYVIPSAGGQVQRLTSNDNLERSIQWSPDSTFLVFEGQQPNRTELFGVNVGSDSKQLLSAEVNVFISMLSPDGERIAIFSRTVTDETELYTVKRDGSELTRWRDVVNLYPAGYHHGWSPNSDYFAYIDGEGDGNKLYVLDMQRGEISYVGTTSAASSYSGVTWWPDSSRIAFLREDSFVSTRPDGSDMKPFAGGMDFTMLSATPNADSIAAVGSDNGELAIYLVDAKSQRATKLITVDAVSIDIMDWSPDGQRIRYRAYREDGEFWVSDFFMLDVESRKTAKYNELGNWVPSQWSPDGHYLLGASDTTTYVYTPDGKEQYEYQIPGVAGWVADGNHLYYVQQLEASQGLFVLPIQQ